MIEFFKSLFDNTVYVPDVNEAFDQLDKQGVSTNPAPAVIAIVRRDCEPMIGQPQGNYTRGRYMAKTQNNSNEVTGVMEVKVTFDISVLSYDGYTTDTLVDELYMRLLSGGLNEYEYDSGVRDVNDPSKEMKVKGHIMIEQGPFGEMSEAVDVGNSGKVYRTTFSVFTIGAVYFSAERKLVLTVPVRLEDMDKN